MKNTPGKIEETCPEFLKQSADKIFRDQIETAYAMYLQETNSTPEEGLKKKPKMKSFLPQLSDIDDRWNGIPREEMVGTKPRTLILQMNSHLCKWMLKVDKVQQAINNLPPEQEQSQQIDKISQSSS